MILIKSKKQPQNHIHVNCIKEILFYYICLSDNEMSAFKFRMPPVPGGSVFSESKISKLFPPLEKDNKIRLCAVGINWEPFFIAKKAYLIYIH